MKDIEEIPTSDLIEELVNRCAPAVFIGYKDEGEEGVQVFSNIAGDPRACFGLCHQMAIHIQLNEIREIQG